MECGLCTSHFLLLVLSPHPIITILSMHILGLHFLFLSFPLCSFLFFLRFIYLFDRERAQQGEQQREREKQVMRGSIPGLWDHDLSQRQMLNHLSHPGTPGACIILNFSCIWEIDMSSQITC